MLHHPQVQLISQSHTNYQLTNSHNIDNSPEVLDKISQMDKIQLAKLLGSCVTFMVKTKITKI